MRRLLVLVLASSWALPIVAGCGSADNAPGTEAPGPGGDDDGKGPGGGGGPPTNPLDGPAPGNPDGACSIPAEAGLEDVTNPRTVVGDGTPASCTGAAFVAAVAKGGVITFDCGPDPITITLTETAKIVNDTGPKIVIDGGGKVTLSGGKKVRILYQNVCDRAQKWTSPDCNNQETPALTLQNLTFVDGDATGLETRNGEGRLNNDGGGGAVYVRGGRFKIVNSRFFGNRCDERGSDVGGGAVRVLDHPDGGSAHRPVYIVNSTFGGDGDLGNACANGGAISSIGTSYTVINSLFVGNRATGEGASSGEGGNGGAIYNDGNTFTLSVCGTRIEDNRANEGGSAIFYVSNNETGSLHIEESVLRRNPKGKFETSGYPGMFIIAKEGDPTVKNSTIE